MATRRLGSAPADRGSLSGATCPDILELADGNFAIIGTHVRLEDITLLADAGVAPHEAVVIIPRRVLLDARGDVRTV